MNNNPYPAIIRSIKNVVSPNTNTSPVCWWRTFSSSTDKNRTNGNGTLSIKGHEYWTFSIKYYGYWTFSIKWHGYWTFCNGTNENSQLPFSITWSNGDGTWTRTGIFFTKSSTGSSVRTEITPYWTSSISAVKTRTIPNGCQVTSGNIIIIFITSLNTSQQCKCDKSFSVNLHHLYL